MYAGAFYFFIFEMEVRVFSLVLKHRGWSLKLLPAKDPTHTKYVGTRWGFSVNVTA